MTILKLELSPAGDVGDWRGSSHVVGSLWCEGGEPTSFVGWVELLSLLERSIHARAKDNDLSPPQGDNLT